MSDKIKVPEMIRMSIRNVLVTPTSFIQDEELLDDMFEAISSDDIKIKYKDNKPTMYVKNAQGIVYPIMVDDDNNVINFTKILLVKEVVAENHIAEDHIAENIKFLILLNKIEILFNSFVILHL